MSKTFRYLVEDYEPDILVSGRPLTMAGEPGPQAERVAAVAQKIADELDLPLEFEDERLSSQEAKRILREQGLNEKPDEGQDRHDRRQPVLADVARSQKRGGFACLALSIRASRIVHGSPRRALLRLGQRPAQPMQRSAQPTQRAAQQPAARPAQPAGGARFKQQVPAQRTQGQAPQSRSHAHHAHGSHGVAPATRSSYNTHARRGAQKKSSPVPLIVGGVAAVLALVADRFLCRAGR